MAGRRTQTVLRWRKTRTNRYGDPDRGDPEEMCVRWERVIRDMLAPDGTRIKVDVQLGYGPENDDLAVDDTIWLGDSDDWYGTGSAGSDTELYRVAALEYTPNLRGTKVDRWAGLVKLGDTMPERY